MNMKLCLLLFLSLALPLVAGCGGGGGGGAQPGVNLTFGTSIATGQATAADISSETSLDDAGSSVTIYNFRTGLKITQGALSGGLCRLRITSGLCIAAVVTGSKNGKSYRLSTIVAQVPTHDADYLLTIPTSLAAEAVAEDYMGKSMVDQNSFDQVLAHAQEYVQNHPEADYSVGGAVFKGDKFGVDGSLEPAVKDFMQVPADLDDALVKGKNAIQQIKEAGIPLSSMVSQEDVDLRAIFNDQVAQKYKDLQTATGRLIMPALEGRLDTGTDMVSIFELTPGKTYEVTDDSWWWYLPIQETGSAPAGQIVVNYVHSTPFFEGDVPGTYKLVAAPKSGSSTNWVVTQTFSGDPKQKYVVDIPVLPNGTGANPSYSGSITLEDKNFAAGTLNFTGSFQATGADKDHYTSITFTGKLTSPEVVAQGTFRATFSSQIPAGHTNVYDLPTSLSMSNASIVAKNDSTTIQMTGSISVTATIVTIDGELESVPTHIALSGTYSNSHSTLNFTGNITGDWTNPSVTDPAKVNGSIVLHGQLTRTGHPTYYADIRFNASNGTATCAIDLREGTHTLKGNGSTTLTNVDGSVRATNPTLTLTNQDGVVFTVHQTGSQPMVGEVKVGSTKVADITSSGSMLTITFTDESQETFVF